MFILSQAVLKKAFCRDELILWDNCHSLNTPVDVPCKGVACDTPNQSTVPVYMPSISVCIYY